MVKLKDIGKSVGKVLAAPFTAGASLRGGKLKDIAKGTIANTLAGLPEGGLANIVQGAVGDGALGSLLGTIANGAQSFLTSGLANIGDALQNKYNLENQKELAKYNADQQLRLNTDAFNKNLEMWNMENAYNSPEQQMKRFEAAGLNPNLIYDQSNTAGSGPTFEAPKFDTGPYNPIDTRMQRAQLALALQQHKAQLENQSIENMMKRQSLILAERSADREDRLADAQIWSLKNNLGLRWSEFNSDQSKPKSWLGNTWRDIKTIFAPDIVKGIGYIDKNYSAKGGNQDWINQRVKYWNNKNKRK